MRLLNMNVDLDSLQKINFDQNGDNITGVSLGSQVFSKMPPAVFFMEAVNGKVNYLTNISKAKCDKPDWHLSYNPDYTCVLCDPRMKSKKGEQGYNIVLIRVDNDDCYFIGERNEIQIPKYIANWDSPESEKYRYKNNIHKAHASTKHFFMN